MKMIRKSVVLIFALLPLSIMLGAGQKDRHHLQTRKPVPVPAAAAPAAAIPLTGIRGIVVDEIHRAQVEERSRVSSTPASQVSYATPPVWRYVMAGVVPPVIGLILFFVLRRKSRIPHPQTLDLVTAEENPGTAQEFSWDGVLQESIEVVDAVEPLPVDADAASQEDNRIVDLAKQYRTGQGEVLLALNLLSHKHGKAGDAGVTMDSLIDQNEPPEKIARSLRRVQGEIEFAVSVRKHQQSIQRSVA